MVLKIARKLKIIILCYYAAALFNVHTIMYDVPYILCLWDEKIYIYIKG